MPRTARKRSESQIYHVMLRGINRSQLFFDDIDRHAFIERLSRYKEQCDFSLLAYALMGNHVHLLMKEEGSCGIPEAVKRLATSYAHYLNFRYDRTGYVFENRFASEPITGDPQLLQVCRYILLNPTKAGITPFEWTSHADYTSTSPKPDALTDTSFILAQFSENPKRARELFSEFILDGAEIDEDFLEDTRGNRISDAEAIDTIRKTAKIRSCDKLAELDRDERDHLLGALKKAGLSIRQISRLTGINRGIVEKAGKP